MNTDVTRIFNTHAVGYTLTNNITEFIIVVYITKTRCKSLQKLLSRRKCLGSIVLLKQLLSQYLQDAQLQINQGHYIPPNNFGVGGAETAGNYYIYDTDGTAREHYSSPIQFSSPWYCLFIKPHPHVHVSDLNICIQISYL